MAERAQKEVGDAATHMVQDRAQLLHCDPCPALQRLVTLSSSPDAQDCYVHYRRPMVRGDVVAVIHGKNHGASMGPTL